MLENKVKIAFLAKKIRTRHPVKTFLAPLLTRCMMNCTLCLTVYFHLNYLHNIHFSWVGKSALQDSEKKFRNENAFTIFLQFYAWNQYFFTEMSINKYWNKFNYEKTMSGIWKYISKLSPQIYASFMYYWKLQPSICLCHFEFQISYNDVF